MGILATPLMNTGIDKDGYVIDRDTGERVFMYICDPDKNTECEKTRCEKYARGGCHLVDDECYRADGTPEIYCKYTGEEGFADIPAEG